MDWWNVRNRNNIKNTAHIGSYCCFHYTLKLIPGNVSSNRSFWTKFCWVVFQWMAVCHCSCLSIRSKVFLAKCIDTLHIRLLYIYVIFAYFHGHHENITWMAPVLGATTWLPFWRGPYISGLWQCIECLSSMVRVMSHQLAVASFIKEVQPRLAKRRLKTNGHLANRGLNSFVKEATVIYSVEFIMSPDELSVSVGRQRHADLWVI